MLLFIIFSIIILTVRGQDESDSQLSDRSKVKRGEFPYQVSLQKITASIPYNYKKLTHFCGGTIVSNKHVLTAAHCFKDFKKNDNESNYYYAVVGLIYIGDKKGVVKLVTDIYLHRNFEQRVNIIYHDIAIIIVANTFQYNQYIKPVKFADNHISKSITCYLTGWSKITQRNVYRIKHLRFSKQVVKSIYDCKRQFPYLLNSLTQFCAGGIENENSCYGDSGSPLVCNGIQYGIVTYGPKACGIGMPTFYTNISYFNNWISFFTMANNVIEIKPFFILVFCLLFFSQFILI